MKNTLCFAITRLPAQKPAHKGRGRNGQKPTITPKAAYAPVSIRAGSRFAITRLPAQKPAHKDRGRNGQKPTITPRPHMLRFLPGLVRAHEKTVDHKIDGFFDAF